MSKGKEAEARKSLERLRGAKHVGIIDAELFRISTNLQMMKWDQEDSKKQGAQSFTYLMAKHYQDLNKVFLMKAPMTYKVPDKKETFTYVLTELCLQ